MNDEQRASQIINAVKEMLSKYRDRDLIEEQLEEIGFHRWCCEEVPSYYVSHSLQHTLRGHRSDEEMWFYDCGTPNGDVILLLNWIDNRMWIYIKKESRRMI